VGIDEPGRWNSVWATDRVPRDGVGATAAAFAAVRLLE